MKSVFDHAGKGLNSPWMGRGWMSHGSEDVQSGQLSCGGEGQEQQPRDLLGIYGGKGGREALGLEGAEGAWLGPRDKADHRATNAYFNRVAPANWCRAQEGSWGYLLGKLWHQMKGSFFCRWEGAAGYQNPRACTNAKNYVSKSTGGEIGRTCQ